MARCELRDVSQMYEKAKRPRKGPFAFLAEGVGCARRPPEPRPAHATRAPGQPSAVQIRSRRICRTSGFVHQPSPETQTAPTGPFAFLWRRGWDSNPRYGKTVHRISNPAHSTTLPPLQNQTPRGVASPSGAYARLIRETRPARFALRASIAVQNRSRRFCRPLCHLSKIQTPRGRGGPTGACARLVLKGVAVRLAGRA